MHIFATSVSNMMFMKEGI